MPTSRPARNPARLHTRSLHRAVVLVAASAAAVATLNGVAGPIAAPADAAGCTRVHKCATTLSLSPVAARQANSKPVTVTGTLRRSAGPVLARRYVAVQYRVPGTQTWHTVARGDRTDTRGHYKIKVPADRTYVLRAIFQPSFEGTLKAARSTSRTSTITYPRYAAPTISGALGKCEIIHNGGESMDLKARLDVTWKGGVYQINQPFGPSTYYYAGQQHTTHHPFAFTDELDDPDQTLGFDLVGAAYRPGLPGISSTYEKVGPVPFAFKQSDCIDVTKFSF